MVFELKVGYSARAVGGRSFAKRSDLYAEEGWNLPSFATATIAFCFGLVSKTVFTVRVLGRVVAPSSLRHLWEKCSYEMYFSKFGRSSGAGLCQ